MPSKRTDDNDKGRWRNWLVPLFATGAVLLISAGWRWHKASEPPPSALETPGPQQIVSVYVSNPALSVQLTEEIQTGSALGHQTSAFLYASVTPPDPGAKLLVLTDIPSQPGDPQYPDLPQVGPRITAAGPVNAAVINVSTLSPDLAPFRTTDGSVIGNFILPTNSILLSPSSLTARLPGLGMYESPGSQSPAYATGAQKGRNAIIIEPATPKSYGPTSRNVKDYETVRGVRPTGLYWVPGHLTTEVSLLGAAALLPDAQPEIDSPSTGQFEQDSFVWHGSFGLSPYVSLVKPGSEDKRSTDDFYSGLALASAAAALIAMFQELPEAIPASKVLRFVRRRKRTRDDQSAGRDWSLEDQGYL